MKILWVEDFGGDLVASKVVIEMFSNLLGREVFYREWKRDDVDVSAQLSSLFERHTFHQIYVCKSYLAWKQTFEQHEGDFDIAIIDINLAAYRTPVDQMPEEVNQSEFDRKAGFSIYHQLIRMGFPDDHIAFFTGEENSLIDFTRYCGEILIDRPKHTFEKKSSDFARLSTWLADKANEEYVILRRGVIDGCRHMREEVRKLNEADLEESLLIYKTTSLNIAKDPNLYRVEILDYLTRLEAFFLLHPRKNRETLFSFIRELADKWEPSQGYFIRAKPLPAFKTNLEERFYRTCQFQMKSLRNWSAHGLLSRGLSEKDVAYFFMLAMRSCIRFEVTQSFKYEGILSHLFTPVDTTELNATINSVLEQFLEQSYLDLKWRYADVIRNITDNQGIDVRDNYFLAMFKALGEIPKKLEGNLSDTLKRQIREVSLSLFYQSYWHGLFPLWIKSTFYANLESVGFNLEPLPPGSFLHILGQLIFKESFSQQELLAIAK